jgi:tetratricopeptide (TPR) repeat protein
MTGLKNIIFMLLMLSIYIFMPDSSVADEIASESAFKAVQKSFMVKKNDSFSREANLFLKKYPGNRRIPEVKLMLADKESDPELALEKYRYVLRNYSGFSKRAYALYKICQIIDLKSKWQELRDESAMGIKLFNSGNYINEFRFMHITALIMLEDYSKAKNECIKITDHSHDLDILAKAIYLLAETEHKTGGNSRSYIYNLKELALGFNKSEIYPSVIFRLAGFYEEKKDYDRAYSAYSDITETFPDSPEAELAIQKIGNLKKLNPKKKRYMPDNTLVNETEDLAISPEYDVKKGKNDKYYAVALGPYTKLKDTAGISKFLKSYDNVRKVKTPYGYMLYIGKYEDSESALATRIRLAEEYGINGNIVRFSEKEKKSYIYEDR